MAARKVAPKAFAPNASATSDGSPGAQLTPENSRMAESPWARMRQPLTLGARDELTLFDAESALGQQLLLMARVGGTQAELGSRNAAHERSRFHLRVMADRVSAWAAGSGATRLLLEPPGTSRAADEKLVLRRPRQLAAVY